MRLSVAWSRSAPPADEYRTQVAGAASWCLDLRTSDCILAAGVLFAFASGLNASCIALMVALILLASVAQKRLEQQMQGTTTRKEDCLETSSLDAASSKDLAPPAISMARAWLQMARDARDLKARAAEDTKDAAAADEQGLTAEDTDAGGDSSGCDTIAHHFPLYHQVRGQLLDGCYESLLERKQDEPWGFVWNVRAHTRKSLIIAGVSVDSPADRWSLKQQELQLPPFSRGDVLVDANGATDRDSMQRVMASTNVVLLRFTRSEVKPMFPKRKSISGAISSESAAAGDAPKFECRVRNTFIDVKARGDESQEERLTQSEPTPACIRLRAEAPGVLAGRSGAHTSKAFACTELDTATDSEIDNLRDRHNGTVTDGIKSAKSDAHPLLFPPTPAAFPATPVAAQNDVDRPAGVVAVASLISASHTPSDATLAESNKKLIGKKAMISGLMQAPQFNGQWCQIEAYDSEMQRFIVRVLQKSSDANTNVPVTAKLRMENLVIPGEEPLAVMPQAPMPPPQFGAGAPALPTVHAPPALHVEELERFLPTRQSLPPAQSGLVGMNGGFPVEACMALTQSSSLPFVLDHPSDWYFNEFVPPYIPSSEGFFEDASFYMPSHMHWQSCAGPQNFAEDPHDMPMNCQFDDYYQGELGFEDIHHEGGGKPSRKRRRRRRRGLMFEGMLGYESEYNTMDAEATDFVADDVHMWSPPGLPCVAREATADGRDVEDIIGDQDQRHGPLTRRVTPLQSEVREADSNEAVQSRSSSSLCSHVTRHAHIEAEDGPGEAEKKIVHRICPAVVQPSSHPWQPTSQVKVLSRKSGNDPQRDGDLRAKLEMDLQSPQEHASPTPPCERSNQIKLLSRKNEKISISHAVITERLRETSEFALEGEGAQASSKPLSQASSVQRTAIEEEGAPHETAREAASNDLRHGERTDATAGKKEVQSAVCGESLQRLDGELKVLRRKREKSLAGADLSHKDGQCHVAASLPEVGPEGCCENPKGPEATVLGSAMKGLVGKSHATADPQAVLSRSAERRPIAPWRPSLRSNLICEDDTAALVDSPAIRDNLACTASEVAPENKIGHGSHALESSLSGEIASVAEVKERQPDANEAKTCEAPSARRETGKMQPAHIPSATSKTVWRPSLRSSRQ